MIKPYNTLKNYELRMSFFNGFFSIFGIHDESFLETIHMLNKRSDADALRSDWQQIGGDFKNVLSKLNLAE